MVQGVARKVAATATPFPARSYTIFTNFNKDKAQTGDEAGDEAAAAALAAILSNSISWLRQRRTSTGNRKAVTPFPLRLPLLLLLPLQLSLASPHPFARRKMPNAATFAARSHKQAPCPPSPFHHPFPLSLPGCQRVKAMVGGGAGSFWFSYFSLCRLENPCATPCGIVRFQNEE